MISVLFLAAKQLAPVVSSKIDTSMYACGEDLPHRSLRVNLSNYQYIIYFIILDAAVPLILFGALVFWGVPPIMLVMYLGLLGVSTVVMVTRDRP